MTTRTFYIEARYWQYNVYYKRNNNYVNKEKVNDVFNFYRQSAQAKVKTKSTNMTI